MVGRTDVARVKIGGLVLLIVAIWMLQRPFADITHDSVLYSLLALSRIHPQSLSHDVFVRFGSQGEYTLFSPIFAEAIRWLGLSPAAACLTFLFQAALLVCAYVFARRHMSASLALLGVGLLVALQTDYGSSNVFHCLEDFLTPRLPAEALVLAGLAAVMTSRFAVAGVCLFTALLLHPIMGSAGVALLLCLYVAIPRPKLTALVVAGCVAASFVLLLAIHRGPFSRFDAQWLHEVRKSSAYLFPTLWTARDWSRGSVPLAVLATGWITGEDHRLRNVCAGCLLIAASGIILTVIYADLLHVVIVAAMQLWRWLWLANLVAIAFSPLIVRDCWNRSPVARAVPLLLASACILRGQPMALVFSVLAVVCALAIDRVREPRMSRAVMLSSYALSFAAVAAYAAQIASYVPSSGTGASEVADSIRWLRVNIPDGVPYAAVLVLACYMCAHLASIRGAATFCLLAMIPCAVLAPTAWHSWTDVHYTESLRAQFAPWRSQIPPDAEVIWPETALGAWYLLDRASYWSKDQVAGDVFSRPKSLELRRRERLIDAVLKKLSPTKGTEVNAFYFTRVDARGFRLLCADPALGYFVTHGDFGPTAFDPITPNPGRPRMRLYLYRCADFVKRTSSVTTASAVHGISAGG